jgi:hypothetical protein
MSRGSRQQGTIIVEAATTLLLQSTEPTWYTARRDHHRAAAAARMSRPSRHRRRRFRACVYGLKNAARRGLKLSAQVENKAQTAGIASAVHKPIALETSGRVNGGDAASVTVVQNLRVSIYNGSSPVMMGVIADNGDNSYVFLCLPNFMTSGLPTTLQAQSASRNLY